MPNRQRPPDTPSSFHVFEGRGVLRLYERV
jgi:hypothetical protein